MKTKTKTEREKRRNEKPEWKNERRRMASIAFAVGFSFLCFSRTGFAASASITVDVRNAAQTISPILNGFATEWDTEQTLIQVDPTQPSLGALRQDLVDQIQPAGLKILRYPGGGVSQFFHWEQSTGPLQGRLPQISNDSLAAGSTTTLLQTPYFGPDEVAQLAQGQGADLLIIVNITSGSPAEAAAWLAYYKGKGIKARYWEIGNEPYLSGSDASTLLARKTALEYAGIFDTYAAALRAVDPTIQVGMVGCHDQPSNPAPLCNEVNWNQTALSNIHSKIDFMSVHNSYAPVYQPIVDNTIGYQALLAAPQFIQTDFPLHESDIANYANAASAQMPIFVTEHAAFWLPTSDPLTVVQSLQRNFSLGSALFSALSFHVFMRDARIQGAMHENLTSPYFQAALTPLGKNSTWPTGYQPNAVANAYFYVSQLYGASAAGQYVPVVVANSPTFDSTALGSVPAESGVPALDAVAVLASAPAGRLYLYVVNRSLTQNITADLQILGLKAPVASASLQQLNGADVTVFNSTTTPNAIGLVSVSLPAVSSGTLTFSAHSLTRFTIDQESFAGLGHIQIYPNPLRPAIGHTQMNFTQLPAGARLRIYTLAGEKVKDLTADPTGAAAWNATNETGQKVASGVYFVLIQGEGDSKTLKVAVQR